MPDHESKSRGVRFRATGWRLNQHSLMKVQPAARVPGVPAIHTLIHRPEHTMDCRRNLISQLRCGRAMMGEPLVFDEVKPWNEPPTGDPPVSSLRTFRFEPGGVACKELYPFVRRIPMRVEDDVGLPHPP